MVDDEREGTALEGKDKRGGKKIENKIRAGVGGSSKEDKFVEVDNCVVPGTLQEHIRLLGRRDFGISLPSWPTARGCCFLSSEAAGSEELVRLLK